MLSVELFYDYSPKCGLRLLAIADSIEQKLEDEYHRLPLRMEGKSDGTWILQDYGEVIVHVFLPQEREFYNLEAFWGHAESIEYQPALP